MADWKQRVLLKPGAGSLEVRLVLSPVPLELGKLGELGVFVPLSTGQDLSHEPHHFFPGLHSPTLVNNTSCLGSWASPGL